MTEAILIDPGGPEARTIALELKTQDIEVTHVLVTHGHFDHLGWAPEVQKVIEGAKVFLHRDERDIFEQFLDMTRFFGIKTPEPLREPDVWLSDGQVLELSGIRIRVVHTPGHSPGSVTYVIEDVKEAYVGDCIFKGSIGRVDLPFSSPSKMATSLKRLLKELSPQFHLFPGHGPDTTLKEEIEHNPFLIALKKGYLEQML